MDYNKKHIKTKHELLINPTKT
uniref:Uncharacterized protein n=1 Tax=Arundo donax TaxID=35708 RepID=A0A0A9GX09_ARUDO